MSEEIVSRKKHAAKRTVRRAGERLAVVASERLGPARRVAKETVAQAHRRATRAVSKRVASMGNAVRQRPAVHTAVTKILDAAIQLSRKQQAALERLRTGL